MRSIAVKLPGIDRSYQIHLAWQGRHRLGDFLHQLQRPGPVWLISDTLVGRLYGEEMAASLRRQGFQAQLLLVGRGERSKSWPVAARLLHQLLAAGADRQSLLVALGGGVVGDLAGFVASIFLRGVPVVQVPTTLLAMVDAAIGGKTAINLPAGKNLAGTFHQPLLVLIDPEFLATLPARERRQGLAEVAKAGFIADPVLLEQLQAGPRILFRQPERLSELLYRAAAVKAAVVSADEREGDRRRILNFGHTLGHALEKASHYRLRHGEAVAIGMAAALDFSVTLTGLPPEAAQEGKALLRRLGLPVQPPPLDLEKIMLALEVDKKRQQRQLVFVLLNAVGQPVIYPAMEPELVRDWLRQKAGS